MKAYSVGKSVILPRVRFINRGACNGMMYHTEVRRINRYYKTLGCDRMDVSGFCQRHRMSRDKFLERYCGGVEAEIERTKE